MTDETESVFHSPMGGTCAACDAVTENDAALADVELSCPDSVEAIAMRAIEGRRVPWWAASCKLTSLFWSFDEFHHVPDSRRIVVKAFVGDMFASVRYFKGERFAIRYYVKLGTTRAGLLEGIGNVPRFDVMCVDADLDVSERERQVHTETVFAVASERVRFGGFILFVTKNAGFTTALKPTDWKHVKSIEHDMPRKTEDRGSGKSGVICMQVWKHVLDTVSVCERATDE